MLMHKGYMGYVEFDDEIEIFHGEVINTRDVITFQGSSVAEIKQAFEDSVDDYLIFCEERGEEAEKPFSGKFNLRVDPQLHRQLYAAAKQAHLSLNQWITSTLKQHIQLNAA